MESPWIYILSVDFDFDNESNNKLLKDREPEFGTMLNIYKKNKEM